MATTNTPLSTLETFLETHPSIEYTPPTSPSFPSAKRVWNNSRLAAHTPLAVVSPHSATDISALITFTRAHNIPITIRAGGHNLEGRALVNGALLIDLRAFTAVSISPDRKTATVGGGILQAELASKLWDEGLATPTGAVPGVGYVGWAMYGGYGPFSSKWGLGVDQIVGATVVTADGAIVSLSEGDELLAGIKGGGGLFGVIVDVTIKVYPLTTLLAGPIIFDSLDIPASLKTFNNAYAALLQETPPPPDLSLQQIIFNAPTGRTFAVIFVWSSSSPSDSSLTEGLEWSKKIESLAPVAVNLVSETTIPNWFAGNASLVPENVFGSAWTMNVTAIEGGVLDVFAQGVKNMPSDPVTMVSIHELRSVSPSVSSSSSEGGSGSGSRFNSVFDPRARRNHYMLEILGFATIDSEDVRGGAEAWAGGMAGAVAEVAGREGTLLENVYVSLFDSRRVTREGLLGMVFGENVDVVRRLKGRVDPEGVFRLAVPEVEVTEVLENGGDGRV
ncbi:D-lactate dehydrogenase [Aspergillus karnatakaensis]|uniref:FAD-binding oxidoreductase n=1 Tax=Aspergillus karnatakaensis TaxID=1810916 RepID=UPI003CCDD83E